MKNTIIYFIGLFLIITKLLGNGYSSEALLSYEKNDFESYIENENIEYLDNHFIDPNDISKIPCYIKDVIKVDASESIEDDLSIDEAINFSILPCYKR